MLLGGQFLLAFSGGLAEFWSLRSEWLTVPGTYEHLKRLKWGTGLMALFAWLSCLTGTYLVSPWYRAAPPADATNLAHFPRTFLLATPGLADWHRFGMEWQEHIAWWSRRWAEARSYQALPWVALRVATILSQAFASLRHALTFSQSVGPLSGKTTFAVFLWLFSWGGSHWAWRNRAVSVPGVFAAALLMIVIGLLLTFPPIYTHFGTPWAR